MSTEVLNKTWTLVPEADDIEINEQSKCESVEENDESPKKIKDDCPPRFIGSMVSSKSISLFSISNELVLEFCQFKVLEFDNENFQSLFDESFTEIEYK
jgi:hypothetical protein